MILLRKNILVSFNPKQLNYVKFFTEKLYSYVKIKTSHGRYLYPDSKPLKRKLTKWKKDIILIKRN